jgi:hypothetical protein
MAPLNRLAFHKDLVNALRDLSLSDHILLRLEAIPMWTSFWELRLQELYATAQIDTPHGALVEGREDAANRLGRVEKIFSAVVSDLLEKRLVDARVPALSVNILMSLAGMCSPYPVK